MLWVKSFCFSKIVFFLKNMVSLYLIRSVHSVFRPIEIFKIWERESLFVSTDRGWFLTVRNSWISFLKKDRFGLFQSYFSNSSFVFSLSTLALGSTIQFLSFSFNIFARFLSLEADKSLLPFFFKFISWFHALSWVFLELSSYWGFWWFEPILVKLINGFLCYDAIMMFPIV